jgi:ribose 5-phosphate isomerase RpiB
MKKSGEAPELTYLHTSFLAALLLNAGRADFVVAGCGTGQGFLNAVMQYPGVICGHILSPLDAWLFPQINAGNCVSLMLNQGFGWASDINLKFIFDALFEVERGAGYPPPRSVSQRESRTLLAELGRLTHRSMADIVRDADERIVEPALSYPGVSELLAVETLADKELATALRARRTGF